MGANLVFCCLLFIPREKRSFCFLAALICVCLYICVGYSLLMEINEHNLVPAVCCATLIFI